MEAELSECDMSGVGTYEMRSEASGQAGHRLHEIILIQKKKMKMKKAEKQNTQPYTKVYRGSVARLHHARRATLLCGV